MKKLLTVLLAFIMLSTYAQTINFNSADLGKNFKGFLVTDKHDTIKGSFFVYLQFVMQNSCMMSDANGKTLFGNTWDNTIYYELENGLKWYSTKFTTLIPPADKKRTGAVCFLHVIESGPITLYDYNFYDKSKTPEVNIVKTYMQLPDKEVIDFASFVLGFPKKMSENVKDYPELATKIANKEKGYGFLNINTIVKEYNTWYLGKNPGFTIMKKM
jgi:hypothetical protein